MNPWEPRTVWRGELTLPLGWHEARARAEHSRSDASGSIGALGAERREAQTLMGEVHPNLLRGLDYFEAGKRAFLVTEFIAGQDLGRWLRDVERSPHELPDFRQIGAIMGPVLSALAALHRRGVYHCDVKPANILLDVERDRPVLIDLGNASMQLDAETGDWPSVFTPGYSPDAGLRLCPKERPQSMDELRSLIGRW